MPKHKKGIHFIEELGKYTQSVNGIWPVCHITKENNFSKNSTKTMT